MSDQILQTSIETESIPLISVAPVPAASFARRVALTFATRVAMVIGSFGASIVVARWLSARGLGELSVINVTISLAVQIASIGLPSAIAYHVSKDREVRVAASCSALLFGILAGIASSLIIASLALVSPGLFGNVSPKLFAIAAISIPFTLLMLLGYHVLLALEKPVLFNLLDIAAPLLMLLNAVLVLVVMRSGLVMLVSFNTAANCLIGCAAVVIVAHKLRQGSDRPRWRIDPTLFQRMLGTGVKFYIAIVAGLIIVRADLLIVNHFRGKAEAGVYAVASQLANLLMVLPAVIVTILFPKVAASDDQQGILAMRVTRHTSLVMFIICAAMVPLAFALPAVYGNTFSDSTIQLLILLPGVYLLSVQSVLAQQFLAWGVPATLSVFWILTAVLSVTLNLILVPKFGARAAAVDSTISYSFIFLLVAIYSYRRTGNRLWDALVPSRAEFRELLSPARWRGGLEKA
jgi:O-antigen/teichoic acid export membrane protein